MYEAGLGVVQDYQQALRLYLKSAERGDIIAAPGMVAAANLYRNGYGTVKDEAIARQWLEKAAATGYQPAVDALK
jgi:TPR repeat protein